MQITGYSHHFTVHWSLLLTDLKVTFAAHVTHTVLPHVTRCITRVTQVTLPQVTSHSVVAGVAPFDHVIQISSPLAMLITP